jgi:glycosyltransferase involved in cell wall biosynthesis
MPTRTILAPVDLSGANGQLRRVSQTQIKNIPQALTSSRTFNSQALFMAKSNMPTDRAINVLYDISMLGIAAKYARTFGLSRTAQALMLSLAKRADLKLSASCSLSFEIWSNCRAHIDEWTLNNNIRWLPGHRLNDLRYTSYRTIRSLTRKLAAADLLTEDSVVASRGRAICGLGFQGIAAAQIRQVDVYHSPYHYIPEIINEARHITPILTVHDLIPVLYPEYCGITIDSFDKFPKNFEFGLHSTLRSIDRGTWIICPSQATRNDLLDHLGAQVDPDKVGVIPWGASGAFYRCTDPRAFQQVKQKYGLPDGEYVLSLCALEPRKNLTHVVRCFRKLVKQEGLNDLYLVLAGPRGWQNEDIIREAHQDRELRRRFIFPGYIDDADLAPLYSNALAFVYMSFYEGFGLPPLEAMQCGAPTIVSNTSSLPEVVGDAGITLDPRDEDSLCQELVSLYQGPQRRLALAQRSLRRAQSFSWPRCAEATAAFYRRAISRPA